MLNKYIKKCNVSKIRQYSNLLKINENVKSAIERQEPVVALESTIITHGMPYPENIRTALNVEKIIRNNGCTPATIGVLDGKLTVGIDQDQLEYLAKSTKDLFKVSRRDLSYVLSQKHSGGTTVSVTMIAAHQAGIHVFVTGGIGGVHRDASETFDISADLAELGQTPVAVVCAGVKSILDIPLTMEYLETQGVPVISYGPTKDFPAFFSPSSGVMAPINIEDTEDVAALIHRQLQLKLNNGIVIGCPIPTKDSAEADQIELIIQDALQQARKKNISGREITPFVLEKVAKLSDGKSMLANIKLIENNAVIGSKIALKLSELQKTETHTKPIATVKPRIMKEDDLIQKRPVVIGGTVFDLVAKAHSVDVVAESTNPGRLYQNYGGVARNIAECLCKLESSPLLISQVGKDEQGDMVLRDMQSKNMDTAGVYTSSDLPTASYSIMANHCGDLIMAVGDMDINYTLTPQMVSDFEREISVAPVVVIDGNSSAETLRHTIALCRKHKTPVWYEPACFSKAGVIFSPDSLNIDFASPNFHELKAIAAKIEGDEDVEANCSNEPEVILREAQTILTSVMKKVDNLIVTMGNHGVLVATRASFDTPFPLATTGISTATNDVRLKHYPAAHPRHLPVDVKTVSGAGDSFAAGVLYGMINAYTIDTSIRAGLRAANLSLQTHSTISEELTPQQFTETKVHQWADFQAKSLL